MNKYRYKIDLNMEESYKEKTPLVSIIIPTKNRQEFCLQCIRHIVSLNLNDIEIIVQDNSDTRSLRSLLDTSNLLKYTIYEYCGKILSFVDNFSKAVEKCSGEYICMIGDDDTILPNLLSVAKYAKRNDIDAVIPRLLTYFWPSKNPIKTEWENGFLATLPFRKEKYEIVDSIQALRKLIQNNFQDYQNLEVPRIYHGLVKRSCIEEVKRISGVYFGGLTPDMFMSVSLCFIVKKVVSYTKPFTISGICPKSGSADSATGRHTGELKDAPHFRGHSNYNWTTSVPYIYTVETIWAETGIQAIIMMNENEFLQFYSPKNFTLILAKKYPQFTSQLLKFGKQYNVDLKAIKKYKRIASWHSFFKKMFKVKKIINWDIAKKIENVPTLDDACNLCCSILKINK